MSRMMVSGLVFDKYEHRRAFLIFMDFEIVTETTMPPDATPIDFEDNT